MVNEYEYTAKLFFESNGEQWNEKSARAIELFGLPGDRFITRFTGDYIEFAFKDDSDRVHFMLACV